MKDDILSLQKIYKVSWINYFKRKLKKFDIPLHVEGSDFTKNVLKRNW